MWYVTHAKKGIPDVFFVAPATQAKVCFNEVKKVLLWVVEMYLNFRRHDEEVWIDEPDAHLYSWLYGWIFATTLKLKKSYVNSSIFKISGLLKWSRVLRSSPFRILNSLEQEFWCHPRRIHNTDQHLVLMMRNTRVLMFLRFLSR